MNKKLTLTLGLTLLLTACASDKKEAPTVGRIGLIPEYQSETRENSVSSVSISLGEIENNSAWEQQNASSTNKTPHTAFNFPLDKVWSVSAGEAFSTDTENLARPVVSNNKIYTMDHDLILHIHDLLSGTLLTKIPLSQTEEMSVKTTGMAVSDDKIVIALGNGVLLALSDTGNVLWEKQLPAVQRAAPTISGSTVFISTTGNQLFAVDLNSGKSKWNYKTLESETTLFGMAQPAVYNNTVVAAFTTGEVSAFDTETGFLKWSHMLLSPRAFNVIMDLSHIQASPIIDQNTVYVFNATGKMSAWNLHNGNLVFTKQTGAVRTPILSGNALFYIDPKNTLIAMNKKNGHIFWKTDLPKSDQKDSFWLTPVLAENHLLMTSNTGQLFAYDTQNGTLAFSMEIPKMSVAPVAINKSLLLYSTDADLTLYQ